METGTIINQYKIISPIGKGGMGEVFLAQDTKLDRKVAIKFLNEELSRDADKLNRFIQEAKAVSALNHPNILTVYEIGEKDEANFIVTEFIEGKTLRENLSPKKTNSLNEILKIGVQVAEALSAAHQAGIIHRDIKPENIMIRHDGYAKVLDFGLAKLSEPPAVAGGSVDLEDTTKGLVKTNPGMVMGTVSYMSPEQARGKETDARTDIWSLGVVLYEMLAGRLPFTGETINHTIVSILEKEPKLLENVPDELQRIVRKTLTKEVEMRYQTARDLLIDLKNLRRDLDIQGELERSVVPNQEVTTNQVQENETQIYTEKSIEETKAESEAKATQNVTTSSSLEYAVTQAKSHKVATAIIGIILLSVISAIAYFGFFANRSAKQINSIAVMPFENKNSDADTDYLSDGLAESLVFRLMQLPDLRVSPTSSVMRYKGKETDIAKIASELGVDAVMTGRLTKRGDNLNITVELVDARTNKSLWGEQYERKLSELLTTQREIVTEIVGKLQLKLSGESQQKLAKKYTDNNEAYQLYLKGKFYWNKRTGDDLKQAVEFYRQAIEKDPNYALAYSGLAETYVLFAAYDVAATNDSMPQAKAAALRALEIDDSLAEAHIALGKYLSDYELKREEGIREFQRAVTLKPNYATGHHWLGMELSTGKRFDESIASLKHAEEIDPLSQIIGTNLGDALVYARRYDEGIAQYKRVLVNNPNFWYAHLALGIAYGAKGMYTEAIAETRLAVELNQEPSPKGYLALWLAKSGQKDEALKTLAELKQDAGKGFVKGMTLALVYIGLGDKDEALKSLENEAKSPSETCSLFAVAPELDDLCSDPRFKDLLKRMNLPE